MFVLSSVLFFQELPKNLFDGMHHFPNPCIMSINGVSVAISSADILKHMAGQM
jgi:hypothetical protein